MPLSSHLLYPSDHFVSVVCLVFGLASCIFKGPPVDTKNTSDLIGVEAVFSNEQRGLDVRVPAKKKEGQVMSPAHSCRTSRAIHATEQGCPML